MCNSERLCATLTKQKLTICQSEISLMVHGHTRELMFTLLPHFLALLMKLLCLLWRAGELCPHQGLLHLAFCRSGFAAQITVQRSPPKQMARKARKGEFKLLKASFDRRSRLPNDPGHRVPYRRYCS